MRQRERSKEEKKGIPDEEGDAANDDANDVQRLLVVEDGRGQREEQDVAVDIDGPVVRPTRNDIEEEEEKELCDSFRCRFGFGFGCVRRTVDKFLHHTFNWDKSAGYRENRWQRNEIVERGENFFERRLPSQIFAKLLPKRPSVDEAKPQLHPSSDPEQPLSLIERFK